MQEEREHLLHLIFIGLFAAALGLLALMAFTAAVVVLLWTSAPVLALVGLGILYGGSALFALPAAQLSPGQLEAALGHPRATQKGPRMSGKKPRVTALTAHKQLLIVESEINRALLVRDCEAITGRVRQLTVQVRQLGAIAGAGGLLASIFSLFRRPPPAATRAPVLVAFHAGPGELVWAPRFFSIFGMGKPDEKPLPADRLRIPAGNGRER